MVFPSAEVLNNYRNLNYFQVDSISFIRKLTTAVALMPETGLHRQRIGRIYAPAGISTRPLPHGHE
jgi:hypothetical protein